MYSLRRIIGKIFFLQICQPPTKESFASPSSKVPIGTLITIGDAIDIFVIPSHWATFSFQDVRMGISNFLSTAPQRPKNGSGTAGPVTQALCLEVVVDISVDSRS